MSLQMWLTPPTPSGQAQFPTGATLGASHSPCCDSETQRHCRNSIPTNSTWTELQGETGRIRTFDTLQYTNGLHSFQPTRTVVFELLRMGRFWKPVGGQTFCLYGSCSMVFILVWLPLLDIHPLPDWKHEPCSQGQIFIYKGSDCSQVNHLKLSRPFGLQVHITESLFLLAAIHAEIQSLLHIPSLLSDEYERKEQNVDSVLDEKRLET